MHKKKVGEVKAWLEACQSGSSGSKVLLLVGPPGAGKSTTVHVLCKPLNLQVSEWQTPVPTLWEEHVHHRGVGPGYSSKLDDFDAFLDKAEKFPLVPLVPTLATLSLDPQTSNGAPRQNKLSQQVPQGKVVLIDDMPLAAEGDRRQRLCDSLEMLARSARFPTVVILSDGQAGQSGQGDNQPRWGATAAFQQALERGGAARVSPLGKIISVLLVSDLTQSCFHTSSQSQGCFNDSLWHQSTHDEAYNVLAEALELLKEHFRSPELDPSICRSPSTMLRKPTFVKSSVVSPTRSATTPLKRTWPQLQRRAGEICGKRSRPCSSTV